MKRTSEKEIAAVLALDGPARFKYFVKKVVDWQAAWGLWRAGGWLMMADGQERLAFPLWPAHAFAKLHCNREWADAEVRDIPLEELLGELLPMMVERTLLPGIFPTPKGNAVTLPPRELEAFLRDEMTKYGELA